MSKEAEYRKERIERLLSELQYEVTRGMLECEIEEEITFTFMVPVSRKYPTNGVTYCEFRARPLEHPAFAPRMPDECGPVLRVVK